LLTKPNRAKTRLEVRDQRVGEQANTAQQKQNALILSSFLLLFYFKVDKQASPSD